MGYYGKEEDRANLRRCGFANPTNPLYCSRSPFHIFITHHEAFLEDQVKLSFPSPYRVRGGRLSDDLYIFSLDLTYTGIS